MLLVILALFTSLVTLIYFLLTRHKNYWKKRGVPHPKPSLLVGNYGEFMLLKKNLGSTVDNICKQFPKDPIMGVYYGTEPAIIVKDPEIVKIVTTKDFYYFSSREVSEYTHKESMTKNLFNESGDYWRVLRQNLTPLFSSSRMRNMFPLIKKCTNQFEKLLIKETEGNSALGVRILFSRFTMDCIGSCVFGIETNVMMENDINDNAFKKIADTIFNTPPVRVLKIRARSLWPGLFYSLGLTAFPKEVEGFFKSVLLKVFGDRNNKPSGRQDFVDLILSFKNNKFIVGDSLKKGENAMKVEYKVDDELLIAQCLIFFAAGFETSATTASYTLYELAKNEEAQRKVIAEVDEYLRKHDGNLEYDCVTELPYLDACIDEALRLYPVLGLLTREVVEDYTLPSGLVLEKGLRVHIPVYHLQNNPEYFPEPEEYRPERFYGDEKRNINPHTYMPFGEGPRICIGMRFAKMQMIAGLITILRKYRVAMNSDTPLKVDFDPRAFITLPKNEINVKFIPRQVSSL